MEMNLKMQINDVYGGDGITRPYQVEAVKLSRSQKHTRTRTDIGVPIESETSEEQTELKDAVCQTFKHDEDGTPILRIGGVHGKLWGTLKDCAKILKDSKGTFKSYAEIERFMLSVNITPVYARLENVKGMRLDALPQILQGRRSSMITQYFDVIESCTVNIGLSFPDQSLPRIKEMLKQLEQTPCLNKRRSTIKILEE